MQMSPEVKIKNAYEIKARKNAKNFSFEKMRWNLEQKKKKLNNEENTVDILSLICQYLMLHKRR